jgi:hypothetical protein
MPSELTIFVCNTPAQIAEGRLTLHEMDYTDDQITEEKVSGAIFYDAQSFGGGGTANTPSQNRTVLIGRKG